MAAFPTTNIDLKYVNQYLGYMTAPYNFTNLRGRTLYDTNGNTFTTPTTGPISFDNFKGQLYATNCGCYNLSITNYASKSGAPAYTVYSNINGAQTFCVSDSFDNDNHSRSDIIFYFKGDPITTRQRRRLTVTFFHRAASIKGNGLDTKEVKDQVYIGGNNPLDLVYNNTTLRGPADFTNTYTQILENIDIFGTFVRVYMYLDGRGNGDNGVRWENTTTVSITPGDT
jgi:hypothetical protein